jgi:MscS family membrane protein
MGSACFLPAQTPQQDSVGQVEPQVAQQQEIIPSAVEELNFLSLKTPRHTVNSHLYFLQPDTYDIEKAAKTFAPAGKNEAELELVARQLKQIYDGEGFYVDVESISNNPDFVDSASGEHRYKVYPRYPDIYLEKRGADWVYSTHSVDQIPRIHKKVYPFGSDLLVRLFPKSGHKSFLGLKVWQYTGILLLLLLGFLAYKLLDVLFEFFFRRLVPRISKRQSIDFGITKKLAHPLSLLVVAWIILMGIPILQLPINLGKFVSLFFRILIPVFGIVTALRLVDFFSAISEKFADKTETNMDDQLVPVLRRLAKFVVVAIGIVMILQNLDVNVTAILAGLSIGGLALALAAQDTVKNFFGSVTIFLDKPFLVGDWVDIGSYSGSVEEVGVRSTRVRTVDGGLVTVPNGILANQAIFNGGTARIYRRYNTAVSVTYDTPPDLLEKFVEEIKKIVNGHSLTKGDNHVYFSTMAASSLDIYLGIYFDTQAFQSEMVSRQEIFLSIMRKAEEMGVKFAFPSTSVYIEQAAPEGK